MATARIWIGFVVVVGWLFAATATASAQDVIRATDLRMSGSGDARQLEITFDRAPGINLSVLGAPYRLILDMGRTNFIFEPESLKPNGWMESVRFGDVDSGHSRLVLVASKPFVVENFEETDAERQGSRKLTVKLHDTSVQTFEATLADQQLTTGATAQSAASLDNPTDRKFTIVLDPGHGGIDGGAKGTGGTPEKSVTLDFAKELKKRLNESGRYDVILTREDDRFIRLDERVSFARTRAADLFISIHADTIRHRNVRGATVYTVSDEASDTEAAELAARENLADQAGGIDIQEENQEVTDILVDLLRRETHIFSVGFARNLIGELSSVTEMIKNPHRHAGFRVLRAPDVPSVLVELGYLSNRNDEAQLLDPVWRGRMVDSIVVAIDGFAGARQAAGN